MITTFKFVPEEKISFKELKQCRTLSFHTTKMESLTKTSICDELTTEAQQVWYHLKAYPLDYLHVEKSLLLGH